MKSGGFQLQLAVQRPCHGGIQCIQILRQGIPVRNRQFRTVRRCGRPKVCHIVRNGHIRFVAYSGDHRDLRFINGVGHPLVIKGP